MKASVGAPIESPFRPKQTHLKTLFMVPLYEEMLEVEGASVLHHHQRALYSLHSSLATFSLLLSFLFILTDSGGGVQLTPLILYAGSHSLSPSIYLFLFLPHWLTHSCSRSIKLIKGSILSWSPPANTSANQ